MAEWAQQAANKAERGISYLQTRPGSPRSRRNGRETPPHGPPSNQIRGTPAAHANAIADAARVADPLLVGFRCQQAPQCQTTSVYITKACEVSVIGLERWNDEHRREISGSVGQEMVSI